MAGGYGERFWPLSRKFKPKQLQCLVSTSQTMLEQTINRVEGIVAKEDIYIITNEALFEQIIESSFELIPSENVITEPSKKNTGPCLLYVLSFIKNKYKSVNISDEELTIAILAADHFVSDINLFQNCFQQCCLKASQGIGIVTIGITPTRPETGYGYIQISEKDEKGIFESIRFVEKPSLETAFEYMSDGAFLWNSGMFFWRLDYFFKELQLVSKELGPLVKDFLVEENEENIKELFAKLPDISIDYTLMEQARNVFVLKASFGWDDVGSWNSLLRVRNTSNEGNLVSGKTIVLDSKNSVIMNFSTEDSKILTTLGISDLIIVSTDDAILVCHQDHVQNVKKILTEIKQQQLTTLL